MKQKFKFNFSFLDRFKKSPKSNADNGEEVEDIEGVEEIEEYEAIEENDSEVPANGKFLDSSELPPAPLQETSEFDSDMSPEEFAEKTLSGFDLQKHQEKLKEIEDSLNVHADVIREIIGEKPDSIHPEDIDSFSQENSTPFEIPTEFEQKIKNNKNKSSFKFNFPKFHGLRSKEIIKQAFANRSSLARLDKFNWNDFVSKLFSPYSRKKIHSVFIVSLVITATYMIGKNLALYLSKNQPPSKNTQVAYYPTEPTDNISQDINKIASTNLFNIKESDKGIVQNANKPNIESIVCLDAEKPTSLDIKVLDTVVLQDSVKSVASVQVRGSTELKNVREGEKLDDLAEISKIIKLKLIIKNLQTGDCEFVAGDHEKDVMPQDFKVLSAKVGKSLFKSLNPNIKNEGNNFKIKKNYRDSMVNNMNEILTQAKAIQITNPDGSLCFKMTEVVAGSLYTQLNIQENDIVCNINGRKIENLNDLMGLLGRIKEIDQFQIGLKRNGISENLEYNFE